MTPGLKASAILRRVEEFLDRARSTATPAQRSPHELSRRNLLQLGALAGGAAAVTGGRPLRTARAEVPAQGDLTDATVAELQAAMTAGHVTSFSLVNAYLTRIANLDQAGPKVNSIIEVNPDAQAIAQKLDVERRAGRVRGPLHGIPVVLKDNVDTGDRMQTAAGSLGLVGTPARRDSTVAANLRDAGAGVVPISHTQDTVGPHARTVADAAAVLGAIVSRTADLRDPATGTSPLGKSGQARPTLPPDYTQFINPDGLRGAHIGVAREFEGFSSKLDAVFEDALSAIQSAGATLVD